MRPWLVRWEQEIARQLLMPSERARYYAEFLVDRLLRGDAASRYEAYAVGRQNGWLSANDVRRLENMDPIEGGDVYLVPLNMLSASPSAT
jgi:HK97 family phage portal protein